ncbi:replication initiator protein A (plasmid) [Aerococcus urinaeequi]|uniref:Replication initiator protein A n=2 Tax=Lactobacillales TaxID=186826 RepID=A0AAE9XR87_9LACT|nr:replication initiator protein A [Aerococcus urinaeequi]WCG38795.1 replication initiator protein A [Aerococcus urinaeequi]
MTNFNFYTADKAYGELYFQFPKVFLYSDKYKNLSDSAKIAYMVFKDRLQYSITNNWIDENSHVYFIFTNQELTELLNCSEPKVIKIKKELEKVGLLLQVHQGFNQKKKRNEPNRLYLADLEVEAYEVYSYQNVENSLQSQVQSGTKKSLVRQDEAETLDTSGTKKSLVRQDEAETLDTSGTKKSLVNQYITSSKDIKDIKHQADFQNQQITNQFSNNEKATEQELIEQYVEENNLVSAYGLETIKLVKSYSFSDIEQFKVYIDKFYFGWKSAEKDTNIKINPYEKAALHDELAKTFKRVVIQFKQGKTKNINNYLYISLKNVFKDYAIAQQNNETDLPPVPLDNYYG